MKNDEIPIFFDFATHINEGFELGKQLGQGMRGSQFSGKQTSLSSYERKVLRALVEHPDEPDVKLSAELGITRSTVARIRQRLLQTCIKTIKVVDLAKLRFKVLTMVAPTLHFHSAMERKNLLASMQKVGPMVLCASGDFNFCMCYAFREVKGIRSDIKKALSSAQQKKGIHSELLIATFNLRNVNWIRNHEYVGLVEQLLQRLPPTPKRRKRKLKKKRAK
jgi:DNA-binding Lrp family transcriptional regulator